MKKIIFALIALMCIVACQDDRMETMTDNQGGKVSLTVSMQLAELSEASTRALGEFDINGAANLPLQLVVFDSHGLITQAADATYQRTDGDEVYFTVELVETPEQRFVHFLLNASVEEGAYGTEAELIGHLSVGDATPAYWQRVVLPMIADNNEVNTLLKRVPLIRNHAKITVSNKDTQHFTFTGYTVVNVPSRGTVAPYNLDATDGGFALFNNGETSRTYADITAQGYEGIQPADATLLQTADDLDETTLAGAADTYYMYERRNTFVSIDIPTTYLIIAGTYGGKTNYYKLDLIYNDPSTGMPQYYNILRNFHYAVSIEAVNGTGYDTPQEAARHAASNNLTASIDLRDLTNISDGIDRLFVSYTDTTVTSTGEIEVKFRLIDEDTGFNNNDVNIQRPNYFDPYIQSIMPEINNGEMVVDADGWTKVTLNVADLPDDLSVYTYTLRFYVNKMLADGTEVPYLSREVDIHLRRELDMIVQCSPRLVPEGVNEQVAANILIPVGITGASDPYQLFPLEFLVEAEEMTLYPDVAENETKIHQSSPKEMPVRTGASIVPGVTENTFRYLRTVSNDEYQSAPTKEVSVTLADGSVATGNYKVIPCHFKTNTAKSATKVYAQNKYFTLIKEGSFTNGTSHLTNMAITSTGTYRSEEATLTFTANVAGTYTIKWNDGTTETRSVTATGTTVTATHTNATTWSDATSATVSFTEEGETYEYNATGPVRDKLPMHVATATYNGTAVPATTNVRVYTSEANAQSYAAADVVEGQLQYVMGNNTYTHQIPGLTAQSEIWFSYIDGDYLYVASTTADELAAGTAQLVFERKFIQLQITDVSTPGFEYYGQNNKPTLTFTSNKTGTHTVTITESGNTTTYTVEVTANTPVSVTYDATKTFADDINVSITRGNETINLPVIERKLLRVGGGSVQYTTRYLGNLNVGNNTLTITGTYTDTNGTTQNINISTTGNALSAGQYIELPNLPTDYSDIRVTLTYRGRSTTYTLSTTLDVLNSSSDLVLTSN